VTSRQHGAGSLQRQKLVGEGLYWEYRGRGFDPVSIYLGRDGEMIIMSCLTRRNQDSADSRPIIDAGACLLRPTTAGHGCVREA